MSGKRDSQQSVRIISLQDVNLKITGPISGKVYWFPKAGAVQDVDKDDAVEFLKRRSNPCCGSTPHPYFDLER